MATFSEAFRTLMPFQASYGLIGLEYGSRGIRMLQLRRRRVGIQVAGMARVDFELNSDELPRDLVERVRANYIAGGFAGRRCAVCLHRNDVHMQSIRLPKMSDSELADACVWEAAQRFGLDRKSMMADFVRLGEVQQGTDTREEVLLVAAELSCIQSRIEPLLEAGLRPVAIDAPFMSLARLHSLNCRRENDQNRIRCVVEVGSSGSIIMILRGDQVAFCKPVALGGDLLDRAVAEYLQVEPQSARELRERRIEIDPHDSAATSAGSDEVADRMIYEALRPLYGQLAKEVALCLRYYSVTFRGPSPECVYLTGGDGRDPRLVEMIAQSCKVRVTASDAVFDLTSGLHSQGLGAGRPIGPAGAWGVAAGLSLRSLWNSRGERRRIEQTAEREAA